MKIGSVGQEESNTSTCTIKSIEPVLTVGLALWRPFLSPLRERALDDQRL